jgi:acyl-CoA reductase-like NAD-dependent aldehyde dehydrogenase
MSVPRWRVTVAHHAGPELAERSFERLEVGGLMLNEVSTFRFDHMPNGCVEDSGFGHNGVRYAIEGTTERKLSMMHRSP